MENKKNYPSRRKSTFQAARTAKQYNICLQCSVRPYLFRSYSGLNPAVVLFMNGIGTLLFILITKGKAPAYLGSSFAFLAPAGS